MRRGAPQTESLDLNFPQAGGSKRPPAFFMPDRNPRT